MTRMAANHRPVGEIAGLFVVRLLLPLLLSDICSAGLTAVGGAASEQRPDPCNGAKPAVHAAFYLWYGNPEVDGRWLHWNHDVLPHWTPSIDKRYPKFRWKPPFDPHSPFMPKRGTYSSRSNSTLREQFHEMRRAGVDSAMVSWWGRRDWLGKRDSQDVSTDELMPAVLSAAHEAGVGVSFHMEPYVGRTAASFAEDVAYIHAEYGSHPGLWREGSRKLPAFWLYDVSQQHSGREVDQWAQAVQSLRGTPNDGVFFSLWIGELGEAKFVQTGGFDGAYTYFASAGATRGSTPATWQAAANELASMGKLFVPSVGPGYNDERIRPWNGQATKARQEGRYYNDMWQGAIGLKLPGLPHAVTVTSFNEWGEGTQIEPAVAHTPPGAVALLDYETLGSDGYLDATSLLAEQFREGRAARCEATQRGSEL